MSGGAAYYNEFDPTAAAWLRELISRNLIAPGDVDERSIADVRPGDLAGYTQCHFFAGIGVWSLALRRAGWADDRPVWTGSCPCQPFSAAGAGLGFDDERHLWPVLRDLIRECRPAVVFGEQVASPAGRTWLDAVCADLEASRYAAGAADLCAAGVGAPHIRQRLYWVSDADGAGSQGRLGAVVRERAGECALGAGGASGGVGHADGAGCAARDGEPVGDEARPEQLAYSGACGGLADAAQCGRGEECADGGRCGAGDRAEGFAAGPGVGGYCGTGAPDERGDAADWLLCRDGRWRPVEPGTFPLAHGAPARVGRLRGYGNAIHAGLAQAFIEAYRDARGV